MGKINSKGRYITKVGFYDIYAKDTVRKSKTGKDETQSTDYVIYHGKKFVERGFNTKDLAISSANQLTKKHEKAS